MKENGIDILRRKIHSFDKKHEIVFGCDYDSVATDEYTLGKIAQQNIDIINHATGSESIEIAITKHVLSSVKNTLGDKYNDIISPDDVNLSMEIYVSQKINFIMKRVMIYERNRWSAENKGRDFDLNSTTENYIIFFSMTYPGIAESILHFSQHLNTYILYILNKFRLDINEIKKTFAMDASVIDSIELGEGDSHCGGRTVAIISMGNNKILFKPVPADTLEIYNRVLSLYNNQNDKQLYIIRFLGSTEYHWCEFIEYKGCASVNQISNFYYRIGIQLAIIHLLNGTDFHYENLIAHGEHPVFIDLECLLSISCPPGEKLSNSILITRIVPSMTKQMHTKYISALSDIDTIGVGTAGVSIEKEGMFFYEKVIRKLSKKKNIPYIDKTHHISPNYKTEILQGFEQGYNFIFDNKFNILKMFHEDYRHSQYRKVIKPTNLYSELLSMGKHPVFNTDLKLKRAFFILLFAEDDINKNEITHCLDMAVGDVPIHYLKILDTDTSMVRSALENISIKLLQSSNNEMIFQKKLISLAIDYLDPAPVNNETKSNLSTRKTTGIAKVEYIFNNILHSGHQSERFSLCKENGTNIITQFKEGLYNGVGGITFLSLCLYTITKKTKYLAIAKELISEQLEKTIEKGGAYNGRGTTIYLLQLMYLITNDINYYETAILELHKALIFKKTNEMNDCDFIFGYAGCLTLCSNFLELDENNELIKTISLSFLKEILTRKKEHKEFLGNGCYWGKGLTGFSHGNAGIIYSLAKINRFIKDDDVLKTINAAIVYEDTFRFENGWKDLRDGAIENYDAGRWCNGSPGIILSRMEIIQYLPDCNLCLPRDFNLDRYRDNSTHNGICHGMVGNSLIQYIINGDLKSKETIDKTLNSICLDEFDKSLSDFDLDISLMNGILGACYAYLYVNSPNIPLVLSLSLPKKDIS